MPYTTLSTGTTITASWANTNVRDQVVTPFASTTARDSAISTPVEGMIAPITGSDIITYYNGSAWVCLTPQWATVTTAQATTSTSYVDLTTAGPSVTIATGTSAMVTVDCYCAGQAYAGPAVSGATTLAASDTYAVFIGAAGSASRTFKITGLTAGDNTFKLQYRTTTGGSLNFSYRTMTVVALP